MRENHTPRIVDLGAERLRRRGLDDSRREATTEDGEGQPEGLNHPFNRGRLNKLAVGVALAEVVRLDDYRNPGDLEEILRRQRAGDFEARRGALRGHDEVRWPKREPRDTDIFDDWI